VAAALRGSPNGWPWPGGWALARLVESIPRRLLGHDFLPGRNAKWLRYPDYMTRRGQVWCAPQA